MKRSASLSCAAALLALAGCNSKHHEAEGNAQVKITPVKPPNGGAWTDVVSATPDAGVMMGNPNAKVHLIEIGSLTCPHCREFEETGVDKLVDKYVKTGAVSYEFRNYIRDMFDLSALLIAKCNGPKAFFPLSHALYDDQPTWLGKVEAAPKQQLQQLQDLPENQIELQAAKLAGLVDWAKARGVPEAKSTQCLTDTKAIEAAVNSSGSITQRWPDFPGTPSFVFNGTLNTKVGSWDDLDQALQTALGG